MIRILLSVTMLFYILPVIAEVHLAPEIGLQSSGFSRLSVTSQNMQYKPSFGLKTGFWVDSIIDGNFTAQWGVFFFMKNATYKGIQNNNAIKESVHLNYFEYHLNLGYRFIINERCYLFANTGPFLRFGLWGKYESETMINGVEQSYNTTNVFSRKDDALFKWFDYGWNINTGCMFSSGIYLKMSYGLAFPNIAKSISSKANNKSELGFAVGYNINRYRRHNY